MAVSDDRKAHARYSKVDRRIWNDPRGLSPIPPCGQGLWLYFLTTPYLGVLPGLIMGGEAMLAEHLGWPVEGFREAFAEVFAEGMAKADWKARLVVLPKVVRLAVRRGSPESPNVVRGWKTQWLEVPDCPLKSEYYRELKTLVEGLGEGFAKAFDEAIAKPSPNQDQDQEQEKKHSLAGVSDARAPTPEPARVTSPAIEATPPAPESKPKPPATPPDEIGLSRFAADVLSAFRSQRALADLATVSVALAVECNAVTAGHKLEAVKTGISEYGAKVALRVAAGEHIVPDAGTLATYIANAARGHAAGRYRAEQRPQAGLQRDTGTGPTWVERVTAEREAREAREAKEQQAQEQLPI